MKSIIKKILYLILSLIFIILRICKIKQNRIIFSSFGGKGYGENPKYVCDALMDKKGDYELVWSISKYDGDMPQQIKQVKIYSLKWFYYMVTSKVWVNDSRFPKFVKKRKGQFYIQTWHSSLRLKKIEKDVEKFLPRTYVDDAINDSEMMDLIICGSEFSKKTYQNSFWYNGPIAMFGTPKFDIYFAGLDQKIKSNICKKFGIDENKKIVLYAPTFRTLDRNYNGNIDFDKFIDDEKFSDFCFLIRLHPEAQNKIKENKNIVDVTTYPNFQDLLIASDFLITDYSGCCFDALIANKKCVLYVPDLDEYTKKERELYFNYSELPFVLAKNIEELKNNILHFDDCKYQKNILSFSTRVGLCENGDASILVANKIEEVIKNEKI